MTILAVDVDGVVVDTPLLWYEWLCDKSGQEPELGDNPPYDLSTLFTDLTFDPIDFWRQERLYDGLEPIEGCVEVLSKLHEHDTTIVFVSYCKGNHGHSKHDMLLEYFPFMSGAIWTREKEFARCDALIDDRLDHLNAMPDHVSRVLYETPYQQTQLAKKGTVMLDNWYTMLEAIHEEELEMRGVL